MSNTSTERQAAPGLIPRMLGIVFSFFGFLLLSAVISVIIEWVGIALQLWGRDHAYQMLLTELRYISHIENHPLLDGTPADYSLATANGIHKIAGDAGFLNALNEANNRFPVLAAYLKATFWIVQVLAVRMTVALFILPCFVLVGIVALIDGLDERDIRKFEGGTESSFVYDMARPWIFRSVLAASLIYIASPFITPPEIVYIPALFAFYLVLFTASSLFMKIV